MKFLGKNIGENLHDIGLGNYFLGKTLETAQTIKKH